MFCVHNIELLASLFDCCFFVGRRDDANILGVILAHPVNTPKAGHLPKAWSIDTHWYAPPALAFAFIASVMMGLPHF